ncbi:hypothetical protein P692DRAFT_20753532, partial [Suillus brevipes Sb2]
TAQLWNLDTNQPIGTPLHHRQDVSSATFSVDGKFLVTFTHGIFPLPSKKLAFRQIL